MKGTFEPKYSSDRLLSEENFKRKEKERDVRFKKVIEIEGKDYKSGRNKIT